MSKVSVYLKKKKILLQVNKNKKKSNDNLANNVNYIFGINYL